MSPLQTFDRRLLRRFEYLVGVDEAGRGALAGPVAAAACLVDRRFYTVRECLRRCAAINDSKQLDASTREAQWHLMEALRREAWIDFEVAFATVSEIERLNILGATRLAMRRALEGLAARASGWGLCPATDDLPLFTDAGSPPPERLRILIDGRPLKPFPYHHEGLVRGDATSLVVAMASVAAKVARDREMRRLATFHQAYGFDRHKGYGTARHRESIRKHGPAACHRRRFLRKLV